MAFPPDAGGALALRVLRASHDTVLLADAEHRIVGVEGDPAPLLGRTAEELLGTAVGDLFAGDVPALLDRGGAYPCSVRHASGAHVAVEGLTVALPGDPLHTAVGLRASSSAALAAARLAAAHVHGLRTLRVLRAVHEALIGADDEAAVLGAVCRVLVGECGYVFVWVGLAERDAEHTLRPVAQAGFAPGFAGAPLPVWADAERGQGPAGTAVRTGRAVVERRTLEDPAARPWLDVLRANRVGSGVGLPLRVDGVVIGALSVHAREVDAFSAREVDLLEEIADFVGRACGRLRANAARRRAEAHTAEVLDSLGVAWVATRAGRGVVFCNAVAEQMSGLPRDVILAMPDALPSIHPEDRAAAKRAIAACEASGHADVEARLNTSPPRWAHIVMHAVRDERGAVIGHESIAFDISARRDAEAALRTLNAELERRVAERTAELQDLYDNAPCGYHSAGPDGVTIRANATFLRWLGRSREELLGRRASEFLTPESRAAVRADFARLAASPDTDAWGGFEREIVRADGSTFWALLRGNTVRDADGRPIEYRVTLVDITERRRADAHAREQDALLHAALTDAQQAARAKDEFLASMSHELRTPLNGILGLGEALLEGVYGPLSDRQRHAVSRSRESGVHLLSLINDILDVAKVEAGKLELEIAPVQLDELIRQSLLLVQESARRKGLEVELSLSVVDGCLLLDARRMKQVLVNLLSNAVKFTPEGGQIGVQVVEARDTVAITVWDRGIGIPEGDLPRLFQPFVQLDSRLSRAHAGTGLGLTLARRFTELHGGEVRVESEVGRGSRFTVTFPARRLAAVPSPAPGRPPSPPVRRAELQGEGPLVLVAEDEESNALLAHDMLAAAGYRVERARNGAQAVELAGSLRPAVILMDVQMPVMDGLAAIRALRGSEDPALRVVPIIAVTALTMLGDEQRCLSAGADAYLGKPLSYKRLLQMLDAQVRGGGAG